MSDGFFANHVFLFINNMADPSFPRPFLRGSAKMKNGNMTVNQGWEALLQSENKRINARKTL